MVRATKQNSDIVSLKFDSNDRLILRRICGKYYFIAKMDGEDSKTIKISLDDYDLYKSFDKLYNRITEYRPFELGSVDKNFMKYDSDSEYPLVKDGTITWYSDGTRYDKANSFQIDKTEDAYLLTINKKNTKRDEALIKIDTDFSRYSFFYQPLVELYHEVEHMEFDFPQISIEEYLVKSKRKIKR